MTLPPRTSADACLLMSMQEATVAAEEVALTVANAASCARTFSELMERLRTEVRITEQFIAERRGARKIKKEHRGATSLLSRGQAPEANESKNVHSLAETVRARQGGPALLAQRSARTPATTGPA
ncbi:unnamed protein product, partial [Amoebophrya sp. A120]|eukprot:GSA120T00024379001.1